MEVDFITQIAAIAGDITVAVIIAYGYITERRERLFLRDELIAELKRKDNDDTIDVSQV